MVLHQAALINFTIKVLESKGHVSDGDIEAFKGAGFTDAHTAEITVIIAHKSLSNLFNHIYDTDLDLPSVPRYIGNNLQHRAQGGLNIYLCLPNQWWIIFHAFRYETR